MFFNTASLSIFFLAASSLVSSSPIRRRSYGTPAPITPRASIPVTLGGVQVGSDQQGGNLDDFYGTGNFAANLNQVTIIQQKEQLVCSATELTIVRQQLAIIQEFAKQVILQQICEVEIQTVVIQQFNAQFVNFGRNVRRKNGNNNAPSFDTVIAQKITEVTQIISKGGSLSASDLGFLGSDIGRNSVQVGGSNWNDASSPASVGNAYQISKDQEKKGQQSSKTSASSSATSTKVAASSTTSSAAKSTAKSTETGAAKSTETGAAKSTETSTAKSTEASAAKSTEASTVKSTAEATTTSSKAVATASTTSAAKASSTPARK